MVSRLGIVASIAIVLVGSLVGSVRSQPPVGTSIYSVQVDPRLCPSPLCGGYWVALANGARTHCADGSSNGRCYVARAVDEHRHPLPVGIPGGALARATLDSFDFDGYGRLGMLVVAAVYAPAGTATLTGGFYRVVDTGIRCVRAPCFSYRATQVNGSTRTTVSSLDLEATQATAAEVARAEAALRTKNGLYARGRFAMGPDGGRVFRPSRLYLRATRPRA